MPTPAPEDFWKLVAASRLVADDTLATFRHAYAQETAGQPPDAGDEAATTAIAKWLIKLGALSKWQGRRLLSGESGPFFIGDYRLLDRLENDGSGRLFRGRHEPSGKFVGLMVLDRKLCQRVDVWTEVVRRTTIAHDAVDPVLSRTWALEQVQGNRFVVCEDIEGTSLADELARLGPLPAAEACRLMLPIFAAVGELHRRGSVHGSLSLDALRREPAGSGQGERRGRVRLLQMPLAGDPHAVPTLPPVDATERVSRLGRRASFVAPELLLPGRFSDQRSDVYSLGCILHALLSGTAPCWQGDAQQTLSQAAFVGPVPLGPPQVPVEVATLVSYLVTRDPMNRYPDAAEAADALAACIGLPPVSGALPPLERPLLAARLPPAAGGGFSSAVLLQSGGAAPTAIELATRAARKRSARLRMIGLGVAGGLVSLVVAVVASRTGSQSAAAVKQTATQLIVEPATGSTPAPQPQPPIEPPVNRVKIVDSADLPWASPTSGRPPTLAYLPPGSQLMLLARPAAIVADQEGQQFVKSLGPRVEAGLAQLVKLCGCRLTDIEEVQAGWQAGGPEAAEGAVVSGWTVRFGKPSPLALGADARNTAWGETTAEPVNAGKGETQAETIYTASGQAGSLSFWLPAAEEGHVLVIAPAALLKEIMEIMEITEITEITEIASTARPDGDTLVASLPQDLEQLVGMLDHTRHLTLFGSPHYLLHDGRTLMTGPLAGLVEPLGNFFGLGVQAAALSLEFGDNFYAEIDAIASRAEPAKPLAAKLARRFEDVADGVEDFCAAIDPHPYGKKLVMRLPAMLRVVAASARCGAEEKGVVLNAYLPRNAGHNLVLAAELALEQAPAAGTGPARPARAPAVAAAPAAAQRPLQKKISLSFAKDTLEKSIQMVSEEIGMPMEILGRDLQLDGITKNQSFGLDERDATAEAVLRKILAKADSAGRLIYVIRVRDGIESVEISTRAAAAKRGDTLPPGFEQQPDAETK